MKVTYERDKSARYARLHKTEQFYPDLGEILVGELYLALLQEPLDDPQFDDLSVTDKQRLREVG